MAYLCSQNSFILRYKLLFTMRTNYARLRKLFGALSLSLAGIFSAEGAVALDSLQLIPRPVSVSYAKGTLTLPKRLTLSAHTPRVLRDGLAGLSLATAEAKGRTSSFIRSRLDPSVQGREGYRLTIGTRGIDLVARDEAGLRQGAQSLLQIIGQYGARLPQLSIVDSARMAYRGVMLDVSRHFMKTDMIIRLLDEMARYKLNRFHWHLVDGGGWRFPSEKYPLLTKKAAFRTESDWDKWWQKDRRFVDEGTPGAYGGYYTKEEIQRVVRHADRLGITVIPEIELPGHSNELFSAYPELSCLDGWAFENSDVCIGNEKTFTFFEAILDEVMALFPSKYIHIGGDEATMRHWGNCPKCTERKRVEGLKDDHELQSYMIRRIEKYLNSKGRKLIGWDEILMGGLAPDATVMSWRGEEGGIKAAKEGHDVILTPGSHVYLDFYQREADGEPRANGGFTTLEKVYSYNPMPKELTASEAKHILGVQANLWTEYVLDEAHAEYMLFPRVLALAEVAWTPQADRDYPSFLRRANYHVPALLKRGVNAYPLRHIAALNDVDTARREVSVRLMSERPAAEIRYTVDGSIPTASSPVYDGRPIVSRDSILLVARLFDGGKALDVPDLRFRTDYHKGIGKKITYNDCSWNEKYPAGGERALLDGVRGTPTYLDGRWQGFTSPLDVTIDLGREEELSHIFAKFMQERIQWVYMPGEVEVLLSSDGVNFRSVAKQPTRTSEEIYQPVFETFSFPMKERARYVRLRASNDRPKGNFIFCDEIVIH